MERETSCRISRRDGRGRCTDDTGDDLACACDGAAFRVRLPPSVLKLSELPWVADGPVDPIGVVVVGAVCRTFRALWILGRDGLWCDIWPFELSDEQIDLLSPSVHQAGPTASAAAPPCLPGVSSDVLSQVYPHRPWESDPRWRR